MQMDFWSSDIWSPLGVMVITGNGLEIAEINFADPNAKFGKFSRDSRQYATQMLKLRQKLGTVPMISNCDNRDEHAIQDLVGEARQQLADYFLGELRNFSLPLVTCRGTALQRDVWGVLPEVDFARTTTYKAVAVRVGRPKSYRPIGQAIGRNPHSIVVPCHRIIGSDGALTGYGGGITRKSWLLDFETAFIPE